MLNSQLKEALDLIYSKPLMFPIGSLQIRKVKWLPWSYSHWGLKKAFMVLLEMTLIYLNNLMFQIFLSYIAMSDFSMSCSLFPESSYLFFLFLDQSPQSPHTHLPLPISFWSQVLVKISLAPESLPWHAHTCSIYKTYTSPIIAFTSF